MITNANTNTGITKWYVGYDCPTLTWQVAEWTQVRNFQVVATFDTELEARAHLESIRPR